MPKVKILVLWDSFCASCMHRSLWLTFRFSEFSPKFLQIKLWNFMRKFWQIGWPVWYFVNFPRKFSRIFLEYSPPHPSRVKFGGKNRLEVSNSKCQTAANTTRYPLNQRFASPWPYKRVSKSHQNTPQNFPGKVCAVSHRNRLCWNNMSQADFSARVVRSYWPEISIRIRVTYEKILGKFSRRRWGCRTLSRSNRSKIWFRY